MQFILLHSVRFIVLSIPFYFLAGCGGDGGPAAVNAQNPTIEQQILDEGVPGLVEN